MTFHISKQQPKKKTNEISLCNNISVQKLTVPTESHEDCERKKNLKHQNLNCVPRQVVAHYKTIRILCQENWKQVHFEVSKSQITSHCL